MDSNRSCPALMISAAASGQGKTTLTAALARYHSRLGRKVRVFKTGPDFIDPTLLSTASGYPVYQLDLWMVGADQCRKLLYEAAGEADLILVEGVMGLFDGQPSSADLAEQFGLPVAVTIDAAAMAETFGAVALGLTSYRPDLEIAGVIGNRVASEGHARMIAASTPEQLPFLGCLKADPAITLPERQLGLHLATDIDQLDARLDAAADQIADTALSELPPPIEFEPAEKTRVEPCLDRLHIAVATDAAFCFVYPANLDLLREMGATLTTFSPLADTSVPAADALYLPGGYPELYAEQLAKNAGMIRSIVDFYQSGRAIVAECGGMLYLLDQLTDGEGHRHRMAGVISGTAKMSRHLGGLGLTRLELSKLLILDNQADQGEATLRGHTFHYSRFVESSTPAFAAWSESPAGQRSEGVIRQAGLTASYAHWYFPSSPRGCAALFGA